MLVRHIALKRIAYQGHQLLLCITLFMPCLSDGGLTLICPASAGSFLCHTFMHVIECLGYGACNCLRHVCQASKQVTFAYMLSPGNCACICSPMGGVACMVQPFAIANQNQFTRRCMLAFSHPVKCLDCTIQMIAYGVSDTSCISHESTFNCKLPPLYIPGRLSLALCV